RERYVLRSALLLHVSLSLPDKRVSLIRASSTDRDRQGRETRRNAPRRVLKLLTARACAQNFIRLNEFSRGCTWRKRPPRDIDRAGTQRGRHDRSATRRLPGGLGRCLLARISFAERG